MFYFGSYTEVISKALRRILFLRNLTVQLLVFRAVGRIRRDLFCLTVLSTSKPSKGLDGTEIQNQEHYGILMPLFICLLGVWERS